MTTDEQFLLRSALGCFFFLKVFKGQAVTEQEHKLKGASKHHVERGRGGVGGLLTTGKPTQSPQLVSTNTTTSRFKVL